MAPTATLATELPTRAPLIAALVDLAKDPKGLAVAADLAARGAAAD
jgi:hypothetical protein